MNEKVLVGVTFIVYECLGRCSKASKADKRLLV